MSKVRYCSNCVSFDISLKLKAGRKTISFAGKDVLKRERFFDTEDVEIQKALEATKDFGTYFYRSGEFDWMKAEALKAGKEEDFMPDIETIKTLADLLPMEVKVFPNFLAAKSWLSKNYTVLYSELKSKEILTAKYAEAGFELKIENVKK